MHEWRQALWRVDKIWTKDAIAPFLRSSPPYLQLAMLLAIYTGQRRTTFLRLPWSAYDGQAIKFGSGKPAPISVADALKIAPDAAPGRSAIILIARKLPCGIQNDAY